MQKKYLSLLALIVLASCSGGGLSAPAALVPSAMSPVVSPPVSVSTSPAPVPVTTSNNLASGVFTLNVTTVASANKRRPMYTSAGMQSAVIALIAVNGAPPPTGLSTTATTNVTATGCASGCKVNAPASPPGNDTFTFTTYSSINGTGSALATSTQTFTFTAGSNNAGNVTLKGIPASLLISGMPSGVAGTKVSQTLAVSADDASGQTITGTYATPITLTDSDTSGAQGTLLSVNGAAPASSVAVNGSNDVVTFSYGGGSVRNAVVSASAGAATGASASFQAVKNPMVYAGPLVGSAPEIDLYAPSGVGSSANVSFSEIGYSGAPYNGLFTASSGAGCANIATIAPASGTSFTISAPASPAAGTCTVTFSDTLGQSSSVTVTYTSWTLGLQ